MASYAFDHALTDGALTDHRAVMWARNEARLGDVLIEYAETGLEPGDDPGSRCGLSDPALAEMGRHLADRGLRLEATDVGLVVVMVVAR